LALSGSRRIAPIVLFAALVGCSRADVYPITSNAGAGGAADAGSTSDGGHNQGGQGAGGSGGSASSTCPSSVLTPGDTTHSLVVGNLTRSYTLHVPPGYDGLSAVPLVVDFHGIGSSGAEELSTSPYPNRLDREGVVMAFPDGLRGPAGNAWNVGPCCVANVDDVAFARALVAEVSELACVDARRVYAVGVLTGGGMVHYLGCHAADVFAAIAPAAFDLLEENVDECKPARPISVIAFRGNGEGRVPYEGGPSSLVPGMPVTFLGARATFEAWARIDQCSGSASAEDANGCTRYASCGLGAEVVLCTKQGGREEPGDPDVAWPVLARHTL
jgi:polyhydroxybutyrate depolymerase